MERKELEGLLIGLRDAAMLTIMAVRNIELPTYIALVRTKQGEILAEFDRMTAEIERLKAKQ